MWNGLWVWCNQLVEYIKMNDIEFKSFGKIENIKKFNSRMVITQKINGTNAQIFIKKRDDGSYCVLAGSRNRWLTVDNDNYGFCAWLENNLDAIIDFFGEGRWYGEWAGNGISAGEGLPDKNFVMFDWHRRKDMPKETALNILYVPVLYTGAYDLQQIEKVSESLRIGGSKLAEFDRPEGIVVDFNGEKYKKVFNQEESKWLRASDKSKIEHLDFSYLLQPIRMEKIKLRDESFLVNYPESLPNIVKLYIIDLLEEGMILLDDFNMIKKNISRNIFSLAKEVFENERKI